MYELTIQCGQVPSDEPSTQPGSDHYVAHSEAECAAHMRIRRDS